MNWGANGADTMLPRSILCAFVVYVDDLFKDTKEGDYAIMDHYEALGIGRNASKGEIKEAFRKLALKYHPDKHAQSPKAVRDGATLRFKQVSEAYEVLSDDRKRSLYNLRSSTAPPGFSGGYAHSYHYNNERPRYSSRPNADAFVSKFEVVLRFLTTRAFLLNVAFAGYCFPSLSFGLCLLGFFGLRLSLVCFMRIRCFFFFSRRRLRVWFFVCKKILISSLFYKTLVLILVENMLPWKSNSAYFLMDCPTRLWCMSLRLLFILFGEFIELEYRFSYKSSTLYPVNRSLFLF